MRAIELIHNCVSKLCPRHGRSAGATFPSHFSPLPRRQPYLQGMRTAPRPIRHSRSSARELARNRLVRPTVVRIRQSLETGIVGDRTQTLRLLVVAQYLSTCPWLALCGGLLSTLARLRPRTSPASRYCFCSAVLHSLDTHSLCGRCFCDRGVFGRRYVLATRALAGGQVGTPDDTKLMITADYDMAA